MKSIKRPQGKPLLVCGCGWPMLVEHTQRHYETTEANENDFREVRGYIEAEWYVNNLRTGSIPNPEYPDSCWADCLRVTGKCRGCNAFFDIRSKWADRGMHSLFLSVNNYEYNDTEDSWPRIVKGRPGIRFVYHEQPQTERRYLVPTLDRDKLQRLDEAIYKEHQSGNMQRFVITLDGQHLDGPGIQKTPD